ncbi:hypothetical protein GGI43DRAFT_431546 [Trichoderma evansii]
MVQGSTALTQMLSTSARHVDDGRTCQSGLKTDYISYSIMATRSLRQLLSERVQPRKEVIVAILAFAAFANLISDADLINIHLEGLSLALRPYGGVVAMDSAPAIRMMIYWIDLNGAYLQDRTPRYLQPHQILSLLGGYNSAISSTISYSSGGNILEDSAIMRLCASIRQANCLIEAGFAATGEIYWDNALFPGLHVSPILHDLLSLPRALANSDNRFRQRECFRLAAIIYLGEVNKNFGVSQTHAMLYAQKLRMLLTSPGMIPSWGAGTPFLLWTLVVAAASSNLDRSLSLQLRQVLAVCLQHAEIRDPSYLVSLISNFLWCDAVFGTSLSVLAK